MPSETGTKGNPWKLKTPPNTSEYEMYLDQKDGKDIIVCVVEKLMETLDLAELEQNTNYNWMRAI